ncbi:tetratricopeptide repeat protein [Vibrio hannami]|uniref:tetratricopeptide repeat protein n=1 Tax=Vibrio hannami TaxID=2717094 RepID=UPI00240F6897|nr:tetratricopeptide repeat protein [Vibrio hannami]MDG3088882.1 tetratricopeptide repeat protein [Vibrio hannami]
MWYRLLSGILILITAAFSFNTMAESSSPVLEEARKLTDVTPSQARAVAKDYLNKRKLVTAGGSKSSGALTREDTNKDIRTPESTIEALLIISHAELALDDPLKALINVEEAESIAYSANLIKPSIKIKTHKAHILWKLYEDNEKVQPLINEIEKDLAAAKLDKLALNRLEYDLVLLKAEVASDSALIESSDIYFEKAGDLLSTIDNPLLTIEYDLLIGKHNLKYKRYNKALYNLLDAYWSAVEKGSPLLLAKTNLLLAELYSEREILDKALDHLSQAADFYDSYGHSVILTNILKEMADIYYQQSRFNLALVQYFNVLDGESIQNNLEDIIETRLDLARTYLQLYNFPLTEQYIDKAESFLSYTNFDSLKAQSLLIQAELNSHLGEESKGVVQAKQALEIGKKLSNSGIQTQANGLLAQLLEKQGNFKDAYYYLHNYNRLTKSKQNLWLEISEDDFTQQREFIEKSIHYKNQEAKIIESSQERARFQSSAIILFILSSILVILFIRRGMSVKVLKKQLAELYTDHYTHPRSGLRNLRLLNVKLPSSLEQSSANFEQWQTGELIHEPLHDKLRFVMIDLPFLRAGYLKSGYKAGLELEALFGQYIKEKIVSPARLYHFSDAMFLYVTPNTNPDQTEKELFETINQWIQNFQPEGSLEKIVRAGIADYPFLPRAYTAINDKELIDILLMALGIARKLSLESGESHWVNLKAIENAPAASFAGDDIRSACKSALSKGLIKIHSSQKIEDGIINFDTTD